MINFDKQQTADSNKEINESKMNFETLYKKYTEESFSPEKIHQIAHMEIERKEGEKIHKIDIINENPEVNIEDYAESIEKVLSRVYEIHPKIIKRIKVIDLSEVGKEFFDENNPDHEKNEEKAKEGTFNGANGNRFRINETNENDLSGITMKHRSFKDIQPRYNIDNPDLKTKSNILHFESILAHELFHNLENLSQYQDVVASDEVLEQEKEFFWMHHLNNKKTLDFTGSLEAGPWSQFVDEKGEIRDRYKENLSFTEIEDKDHNKIKCATDKKFGSLFPEKEVNFPERFISNYARIQTKKNKEEDFCDSMVAYAFDPEFLKEFDEKRGTKKFEWLEKRWGLYSKEKLESPKIKMDIYKKRF